MKIAIPTSDGLLCPHFGHCQEFTFFEVETDKGEITNTTTEVPPLHEPGVLPQWLANNNCNIIIAGGMGQRAINLFSEAGITVITGASPEAPEKIAMSYIKNQLVTGDNACDDLGPGHSDGGCKSK